MKHSTKYCLLLEALVALDKAGEGDSVAADEVRDLMDGPWRDMQESERTFCRDMSAYYHDRDEKYS